MAIANTRERLQTKPAVFIEREIKRYVAESPHNCLPGFGEPIWDEPLVGFADGDDPIFQEYKTVIGDFHLTPREAMTLHLKAAGCGKEQDLGKISVISWVLPSTQATRISLRGETWVPSLRWNYTRWQGQDFNFKLARHLVSLLEDLGYEAVAPELAKFYEGKTLANGPASNWSQRHVAYAAGLGTFSLNDALITPKGIAVRLGSVVTNLVLPPSPRPYADRVANCLFYHDKSCRRCIERCPVRAITEQGHDKIKCREFLFGRQIEILRELGRDKGYVGSYLGCGLCQTKVPCESRNPVKPGE